jgi:hypothetical protein
MAIHSRQNLFRGVNPHLHSLLQAEGGGWHTFHEPLITELRRWLNDTLPDGYYARMEKSLQIVRDEIDPSGQPPLTVPDVAIIRDREFVPAGEADPRPAAKPHVRVELSATVDDTRDEISAIIIWRATEAGDDIPITRLEILSPTNKPPYAEARQYRLKRAETLKAGISMVEVDYLHESSSPFNLKAAFRDASILPDYPSHAEGAYPYSIAVTEPSELTEGHTDFYYFRVDEAIPLINVPLAGGDSLVVDFDAAYQNAYAGERFAHLKVDYSQLPLNVERYSPTDQQRIRDRLAAIAADQNPPDEE